MITLTPLLPPVPAIDASQTTSARKLEWPSELPPSEPQGQCERSRLVTGSLPVSSAEALIEKWRTAALYSSYRLAQAALNSCADDLRRELERATVRQPEENTKVSHDGA